MYVSGELEATEFATNLAGLIHRSIVEELAADITENEFHSTGNIWMVRFQHEASSENNRLLWMGPIDSLRCRRWRSKAVYEA